MKTTLHRAETRGVANLGWLFSKHTFSFSHYYNPERMSFGALRVLNDDIVQPSMGFGTHPHDNMEIISIPLQGALAHKDSTGNAETINTGDVQIMSAGTGLTHSEFNPSNKEAVNFLQLWIFPDTQGVTPRYAQKTFDATERQNRWQTVVEKGGANGALDIHQSARLSLANVMAGTTLSYQNAFSGNGQYLLVLEGKVAVGDTVLDRHDGFGIEGVDSFSLTAQEDAQLLLIEVPLLPRN